MGPVIHQTIRLSRGKHSSPEEGACVMELASTLARARFSDHPVSVCPVIGSLLRAYNDSIDAERRQDLYAYAAKVVGSRGSEARQQARAARLNAWMSERKPRRWTRFLLPALLPAWRRCLPTRSSEFVRSKRSAATTSERTRGCSR